ncbi:MAG: PASTA domain-containing protein [Oscillospiraceae bacterium]|nr:PASTA domain-containing protein [Oscillospiraceae bacterium]
MDFSVSLTMIGLFDYVIYYSIFILLLAALCLFVKAIVDVVRKKKVRKRLVITEFACAVLAFGLSWTAFNNIISWGSADSPDNQPMVNLSGYDYNQCKSVYASYFDMEIAKEVYSDEYPEGTVISHSPEEGSIIEVGNTTVSCVVSKGKQMIIVPNVCGVSCENAGNMIEEAGLNYSLTYEYSEIVPTGWAISTTPKAGEEVEKDSMVEVFISKGKEEDTDDTLETPTVSDTQN